jgi:uncharacterized protein YndB with AHSA1/START domain
MTDQRRLKPYAVEFDLPAGRDEVWDAVTQPGVLRQWFGWDYDGLDAEIQQIFVDQATLLAPERMGWADGSYLEVVGGDDRAVVRAVREGPVPDNPDAYDAIEEAWRTFLVQLRFLFERRPEGVRRTIYLTGETTGRQALSLAETEWQPVGRRVSWTVDADGFLVVVSGRVPLSGPSAARMEVTVSTFGLDDAAFENVREGWTKKWAPIAADATVIAGDEESPETP